MFGRHKSTTIVDLDKKDRRGIRKGTQYNRKGKIPQHIDADYLQFGQIFSQVNLS